ncbi:MAG: UbiA family prenyltransferase, partial [Candidatus Poribacteria bacterium]|nr:UbiA family prenyltransferase [Candidatus Poribacteria bacterium]
RHPPTVDGSLFYLAWGIQILGFAIAFALPLGFRLIYLTAMSMSIAYSHPAIRLKGHPHGSVCVVAIGQGWLTYWAGWIAGETAPLSIFTRKGTLGGLAVTIITIGLYPLTQIYQIESDRAKGDQTLAVSLGTQKSFRFALIGIALAGACMVSLFWLYFRRLEGLVLICYFVGLWLSIYRWRRRFPSMNQMDNYNMVMRLNLVNSACFTIYLALHFLHIL